MPSVIARLALLAGSALLFEGCASPTSSGPAAAYATRLRDCESRREAQTPGQTAEERRSECRSQLGEPPLTVVPPKAPAI